MERPWQRPSHPQRSVPVDLLLNPVHDGRDTLQPLTFLTVWLNLPLKTAY